MKPSQIEERTSEIHTSRTGLKTQYIDSNPHIFARRPPWNYQHWIQNFILHPTQINEANVCKKFPNPLLTLLISYMYLVFVMDARNLWDKFVTFVCYMLSRLSSDKLEDQNQNRRSLSRKWYKPHGMTHKTRFQITATHSSFTTKNSL